MNREEYAMVANLMSKVPPKTETPVGQKFNIGEIVKCTRPMMFTENKDGLYQVQYSYSQKYGGSDVKSYSLKHLFEDNSSSWYDEDSLILIKGIDEINEENDLKEFERLSKKYNK